MSYKESTREYLQPFILYGKTPWTIEDDRFVDNITGEQEYNFADLASRLGYLKEAKVVNLRINDQCRAIDVYVDGNLVKYSFTDKEFLMVDAIFQYNVGLALKQVIEVLFELAGLKYCHFVDNGESIVIEVEDGIITVYFGDTKELSYEVKEGNDNPNFLRVLQCVHKLVKATINGGVTGNLQHVKLYNDNRQRITDIFEPYMLFGKLQWELKDNGIISIVDGKPYNFGPELKSLGMKPVDLLNIECNFSKGIFDLASTDKGLLKHPDLTLILNSLLYATTGKVLAKLIEEFLIATKAYHVDLYSESGDVIGKVWGECQHRHVEYYGNQYVIIPDSNGFIHQEILKCVWRNFKVVMEDLDVKRQS